MIFFKFKSVRPDSWVYIYYINISQDDFKVGGSSFAQVLNKIGKQAESAYSSVSCLPGAFSMFRTNVVNIKLFLFLHFPYI